MCIQKKKKKKIEVSTIIFNVFFTIILVLSSCGLCNAQDDDSSDDEDSFENESQTGNVFVRFFKYGKHSVLYNGLSSHMLTELGKFVEENNYNIEGEKPPSVKTLVSVIIPLLATRYEYRYNIKSCIGFYTSFSVFDGLSDGDLMRDGWSFYIFNSNLGGSFTVLRKNNFSWRMYAGIGIMWGASLFSEYRSYTDKDVSDKTTLLNVDSEIDRKGFFNHLLKKYFSKERRSNNLKHFDIIIDTSVFDFIIKDHWRIALAWKAGIGKLYRLFVKYKEEPDLGKKVCMYVLFGGLLPLVLSIGYQF